MLQEKDAGEGQEGGLRISWNAFGKRRTPVQQCLLSVVARHSRRRGMPRGGLVRLISHVVSQEAPRSGSRWGRAVLHALQGMVWLLLVLLERHGRLPCEGRRAASFPQRDTIRNLFSGDSRNRHGKRLPVG